MRYPFLLLMFLAAIMLTATSLLAATMVITGNPNGPPISWDKTDKLIGVGSELAAKILTEMKVDFSITVEGVWQQVQDKAKAGSVDMIVSAYDNNERRAYMDYSVPYLESPVVIVVKKGDKFVLSSWNVLINKKGVANTGESFGEKFDAFIKSDLNVTYVAYERAFQMLAQDTADYLIIDLYPAIVYSKLLNAEAKIEFIDKPVSVQHFHMTISKKSPYLKLLPEINKKISQLKDQGFIKKLAVAQYQQWHETFKERKRFFAGQQARTDQQQQEYSDGVRDRGLENLGRFIDRERPYMDGSNFH